MSWPCPDVHVKTFDSFDSPWVLLTESDLKRWSTLKRCVAKYVTRPGTKSTSENKHIMYGAMEYYRRLSGCFFF